VVPHAPAGEVNDDHRDDERIAMTPDTFTHRGIGGGLSFGPEVGELMSVSRK
jgi:hypothetical protein